MKVNRNKNRFLAFGIKKTIGITAMVEKNDGGNKNVTCIKSV
jgi:hypothetical protein